MKTARTSPAKSARKPARKSPAKTASSKRSPRKAAATRAPVSSSGTGAVIRGAGQSKNPRLRESLQSVAAATVTQPASWPRACSAPAPNCCRSCAVGSTIAPAPGDRRFDDSTWRDSARVPPLDARPSRAGARVAPPGRRTRPRAARRGACAHGAWHRRRHAGADQHAARQPGGDQAHAGDGGPQPGQRRAEPGQRLAAQRRPAGDGRRQQVQGRREPRGHRGRRDLPQSRSSS